MMCKMIIYDVPLLKEFSSISFGSTYLVGSPDALADRFKVK